MGLSDDVAALAEQTGFSGAVRVEQGGRTEVDAAFGLAVRAYGIPNTTTTRFGTASGSKTFTAVAVLALVEDGVLTLATPARDLLGDDLPLIGPDVTIEHLLAHRSGIGDYLDEDGDEEMDFDDYLMPVPVQRLVTTTDFVPILDGFPPKFAPGTSFSYCNGGYVVLALLAERASGRTYHDLVCERVLEPAGMTRSGFFRSDELPGDVAIGYVGGGDGNRTNVFHLPVVATGDGGMHTTLDDVSAFWAALFGGRLLQPATVADMMRPRSTDPDGVRYGLGVWRHPTTDMAQIEGCDAGVSLRAIHDPGQDLVTTVISNTTDGAWPIARLIGERYGTRCAV